MSNNRHYEYLIMKIQTRIQYRKIDQYTSTKILVDKVRQGLGKYFEANAIPTSTRSNGDQLTLTYALNHKDLDLLIRRLFIPYTIWYTG